MDIEEIQTDARKTFDMRARLAGATRRHKDVTIYTDAEAGAELGGVEDEKIGEYNTGRKLRTGLIGKLDEIQERAEHKIALLDEAAPDYDEKLEAISAELTSDSGEIAEQITALRERMRGSAMTFTLQALPDVIVRDMKRKSRKALGIKGKGIPDDLDEEYALEYTAQMLSASVSKWVDHEADEAHSELTVEDAKALRDFLPAGQFPRLDHAMVELSIEVAISNQATDSADF